MESTENALKAVRILRAARVRAVEESAHGHLQSVLTLAGDAPESFTYVVKLLDVHPALGKVKGRRLMADLGIEPFARVSELSDLQRSQVLAACGENS